MFGCQKINVVTTTVFVNIVMISMDYWNYLFYVTINVSVVVSLRGRHQKPREKLNYRMVEYWNLIRNCSWKLVRKNNATIGKTRQREWMNEFNSQKWVMPIIFIHIFCELKLNIVV
jgi:hypothetical protein